MAGITKFRGKYFVNGQTPGSGGFPRRKLVTPLPRMGKPVEVMHSPLATHVRYRIGR